MDVDNLLVAVVERHELALASACRLELLVLLEAELKRCRKCVALEKGQRLDQRVAFLYRGI